MRENIGPGKLLTIATVTILALTSGCRKSSGYAGDSNTGGAVEAPAVSVVDPAVVAKAALDRCDALASHPGDPMRYAAGVADEAMAPGAAIDACSVAARLNAGLPRAHFEYGRALWVGGRYAEAVDEFALAKDYPIAMKYIGDAYLEGKGLPPGQAKDFHTARDWYQRASVAGLPDGQKAVDEADEQIAKSTFTASRFQNPKMMQTLYDGDLANSEAPVYLAHYVKGIVKQLDSNEAIFLDTKCKPMISMIGNVTIDVATMAAYLKGLQSGKDLAITILSYFATPLAEDQGNRDGVVLFNYYGCDSAVTQKIIGNIMITAKGNAASPN